MEAVFKDILDNNRQTIFRICHAYATGSNEGEDLFQEVLLNIWRSLPGFQHKSAISTWVYRITLNVCMRAKNNADRHKKIIRFDSIALAHIDPTDHVPKQDYADLYTCVRKLEDAEKSLILLFLEDMPYKEIATITGMTENHVAVKIKRIKAKLLTCLTQSEHGR